MEISIFGESKMGPDTINRHTYKFSIEALEFR
jgi:hypothetical protein